MFFKKSKRRRKKKNYRLDVARAAGVKGERTRPGLLGAAGGGLRPSARN